MAVAVWAQRRVQVRYERRNGVVVGGRLYPLGIVLKAGTWYVVANADGSRPPRTYRVSRVREAVTLDETFERPDDFDLQAHWADYQLDYARRVFRGSAPV